MLQKNGQANVHHYNTAIAHLCRTSNEQRELISKMKTEGLVPNVATFNISMTHLCSTSNEQRELISKMKTEGLVPNVFVFNTLIKKLLYEGDKIAAQHVVDVEMPAEGVEPDEKTKATMAQADQLISQKHKSNDEIDKDK